jgi:hypothetical protein
MKSVFGYFTNNNGFVTWTTFSSSSVLLGVFIFGAFFFAEGLKPKCEGDGSTYSNICDIRSLENTIRFDLESTDTRPYTLSVKNKVVSITQEAIYYESVYDAVQWAWGEANFYARDVSRSGAASKFEYVSKWGEVVLLTVKYDSHALKEIDNNDGTQKLSESATFFEYSKQLDCVSFACE